MTLGPFDRRKKRSRCDPCSTSHLKCSGSLPCNNCEKKGLACTYVRSTHSKGWIQVDKGSQKTIINYVRPAKAQPERQTLTKSPQTDPMAYYFHHFDLFLQCNNFGIHDISAVDIKELMQCSTRGEYLKDAIISLGAVASTKRGLANPLLHAPNQFALQSYAKSVAGLRDALSDHAGNPQLRLNVLWATLILGLFELMIDSSGQGWVQHLVHGTSRALVASGPAACQSGLGQRFFMEVKIFEVCRSIVFNESSFLVQPGWKNLSTQSLQVKQLGNQPLDKLLDIILDCSSLRSRAAEFISLLKSGTDTDMTAMANEISLQGFCQRESLDTWAIANMDAPKGPKPDGTLKEDDFGLLALIFHAATSIYLSGVFDYEIVHWNNLGLMVAALGEDEIQMHVGTILTLGHDLLEQHRVSSVLLLFPLRVAGARSRQQWQRDSIVSLLAKIQATFAVAATFKQELEYVWSKMK